jgi:hypothetical protein
MVYYKIYGKFSQLSELSARRQHRENVTLADKLILPRLAMRVADLAALLDLVKRVVSPKELLQAVQKQHPKASKKQIVLATFAAMIDAASKDPYTATKLHGFAIVNRTAT